MLVNPSTLTEKLMYATVRIETGYSDSTKTGYGTGFFYNFFVNNRSYCAIVTAKHVLEGAENAQLNFHTIKKSSTSEGQSRPIHHSVTIESVQDRIVEHPDPNIDLCAIDYLALWQSALGGGTELYITSLDPRYIHSNETLIASLSVVEDVLMVGYPLGLSDAINNYPLFRRGITATHPGVEFEGRPLAGIDLACFPGSSGSPVLIVHEGGFLKSKDGSITIGSGSEQVIFLGVLTHGPVIDDASEIIEIERLPNLITTLPQKKQVVLNLGYYTKASQIHALAELASRTFVSTEIRLAPIFG